MPAKYVSVYLRGKTKDRVYLARQRPDGGCNLVAEFYNSAGLEEVLKVLNGKFAHDAMRAEIRREAAE